jgi:hypothetical protein
MAFLAWSSWWNASEGNTLTFITARLVAFVCDENARLRSRLPLERSSAMPQLRRRIKHEKSFQERLAEEALLFKEAAQKLPPGSHAQELLLRRATQAETASHIDEWLTSPGLQPPKALDSLASERHK